MLAIKNYSEFINESEVAAVADKRDRCALRNIDADAVGQDALHARRLHPGDLLHFAATCIERNAQDAAAAVFVKRSQYRFSRDDVIAGDFNLLWLEQKNFRGVKKKIARNISDHTTTRNNHQPTEHRAIA